MIEILLLLAVVVLAYWVWIEKTRNPKADTKPTSASPTREMQALDLSARGADTDFHIVGEASYQPELRRVAKSGRAFTAVLMAEPTNPHDPNAIRVCAEGGKTVGYLSRECAVDYKEVFALLAAHDHVGACQAKLIGGIGEKKSYGVLLNLRDPASLLVFIRDTLAPGTPVSENVPPF